VTELTCIEFKIDKISDASQKELVNLTWIHTIVMSVMHATNKVIGNIQVMIQH